MMTICRRSLVLAALMFWQGGFTFYAAIVVPVGTEGLGSAAEQALITRRGTWSINVRGAVALGVFAGEGAATRRGRRGRWLTWLVMAAALAVLVVLRGRLDAMFLPDE